MPNKSNIDGNKAFERDEVILITNNNIDNLLYKLFHSQNKGI